MTFARFMTEMFGNNQWVGADYASPEPSLPVGMNQAQVMINGRSISNMPAYDPQLSMINMPWTRNHAYSDDQGLVAQINRDVLRVTRSGDPADMELNNVVIRRVIPGPTGIDVNVLMTFNLGEEQMLGIIKRFGLDGQTDFESQALRVVGDKASQVRLKGAIVNLVKRWMAMKPGDYIFQGEGVTAYDPMGSTRVLAKGSPFSILHSDPDSMTMACKDATGSFELRRPDYYFMNYWCEKPDLSKS